MVSRFDSNRRVLGGTNALASTSCQGPAAAKAMSGCRAVAHFLPYTYLLTCILSLLFLWYIKYSTTYTRYVKIRPLVFASRANLKSHSDVPTSTICHLAPSHPTTFVVVVPTSSTAAPHAACCILNSFFIFRRIEYLDDADD